MTAMTSWIFTGTVPALMTPCGAARSPDFDPLVSKAKELVRAGMSAVVYRGSMGDWPLLTDEERMEDVERLVGAGVPLIAGTGSQNPSRAAALAAHAKRVGTQGLMIIPRVLSRATSEIAVTNLEVPPRQSRQLPEERSIYNNRGRNR